MSHWKFLEEYPTVSKEKAIAMLEIAAKDNTYTILTELIPIVKERIKSGLKLGVEIIRIKSLGLLIKHLDFVDDEKSVQVSLNYSF